MLAWLEFVFPISFGGMAADDFQRTNGAIGKGARQVRPQNSPVTGTTFAATSPAVAPLNIQRSSNHDFSQDGWDEPIGPGRGFRGRLKYIDQSKVPSINRFNIDENPKLQSQIINNVLCCIRPTLKG
ncbi:MAG: hypothetical protein ACR2O8_12270 [Rhizobiaceae bacterium]